MGRRGAVRRRGRRLGSLLSGLMRGDGSPIWRRLGSLLSGLTRGGGWVKEC
ncbi:MAG: hypothetical protein J1E84_06540 [Muribaculaceae bacterium]|nr:hypothetical protein [Muribaculaceae bacterium]